VVSAAAEALALSDEARIELILRTVGSAIRRDLPCCSGWKSCFAERGAHACRRCWLLRSRHGKDNILRKFMRSRPGSFEEATGLSRMEVVAMEAAAEADEQRLYGAILEAIGAPIPGGRVLETERAVHCQLTRLQTRLLVIDETNNLVIGSAAAQRKTLAALRRLSNTLSLSMAFFGTLEALNALMSDPQIEGRCQPYRLARLANDRPMPQSSRPSSRTCRSRCAPMSTAPSSRRSTKPAAAAPARPFGC